MKKNMFDNNLLKEIELDIRSNGKLNRINWKKCSDLSDWNYRIVQAFITEVNLAIQNKDSNFVFKKYNINQPYKHLEQYNLFIACMKRTEHELIITDVINRLVIPQDITYKYYEVWGLSVEQARNHCINKALEFGCEYILFIDDDMIVENTALLKLWETIKSTENIIVAANYLKKADYNITAHGKLIDTDIDYLKTTDLAAMGFTLIDLNKLTEKVPAPYFWIFIAPDGLWSMGEDAFFSKNVIEYTDNYPIIDTRPSILHYDKIWKRVFGTRDKTVTYATNVIDNFDIFENARIPPSYPLINICIPTRTENDLIATDLNQVPILRGYKTELTRIFGLKVDEARNTLATNSVKMGSDYLLFIDNDIVLPKDSICKLLEVMEKDKKHLIGAVSGDYLLKGNIKHSAFLQLNKDGIVTELNRIDTDKEIDSNWLIGLGCCLIRTEVFRQIRYPYFLCYSTDTHTIGVSSKENGGINEDASFSENLFMNGYKIKILTDLKCLHVDFDTNKIYGEDTDYSKYACYSWINNMKKANI